MRQWRRRGGYVTFRRAQSWLPYWHFGWMPPHGRYIYHFRPARADEQLPWPFLKGYIQRHED